jgi:hypothetical protein
VTINKLASVLAKLEQKLAGKAKGKGKGTEVRIGDIREMLKLIATLEAESLIAGKIESAPLTCLHDASEKIELKLRKKRK